MDSAVDASPDSPGRRGDRRRRRAGRVDHELRVAADSGCRRAVVAPSAAEPGVGRRLQGAAAGPAGVADRSVDGVPEGGGRHRPGAGEVVLEPLGDPGRGSRCPGEPPSWPPLYQVTATRRAVRGDGPGIGVGLLEAEQGVPLALHEQGRRGDVADHLLGAGPVEQCLQLGGDPAGLRGLGVGGAELEPASGRSSPRRPRRRRRPPPGRRTCGIVRLGARASGRPRSACRAAAPDEAAVAAVALRDAGRRGGQRGTGRHRRDQGRTPRTS